MTKKISYTKTYEKLEQILEDLEKSEEYNIDDISKKIKEATKLIEICRDQLKTIDEELAKAIDGLE